MDVVAEAVARCDIVLDSDDYWDREICPSDNWDGGKVPLEEDVSYYYHLKQ